MEHALSVRQEKVARILLTPIKCTDYSGHMPVIGLSDGVILTTQTYYPYKNYPIGLDEDMSDFAVGFYEILYRELLKGGTLLDSESGALKDRRFAGDTMNGFNYIANRSPGAGRSAAGRTPELKWQPYLRTYHHSYHCLANFWLLPIEIGRQINDSPLCKGSYQNDIKDYVDRFLSALKVSRVFGRASFSDYACFEDFVRVQMLSGSYVDGDLNVTDFSDDAQDCGQLVGRVMENIRRRAMVIAGSDLSEALWDYFSGLGLTDGEV